VNKILALLKESLVVFRTLKKGFRIDLRKGWLRETKDSHVAAVNYR
jgi:hypothetical protein